MINFLILNNDVVLRLGLAVLLGIVIGVERVWVGKEAGMKTHALVSLGAAVFVVISEMVALKYAYYGNFDPTRIASQIIVGIGFLGAGSIILQGNRVLGLTTAGGLWVTAGVGMAAGFGFYGLAVLSTVLILFIFLAVQIFEKPVRKLAGNPDTQN